MEEKVRNYWAAAKVGTQRSHGNSDLPTRALDVSEQKELWGFNRNFILQVCLLPLESLEP